MSAATRLPFVAGTLSLGALAASVATIPSARALVAQHLGESAAKHLWKIAALAFALANLKNIPGFWHIRVLRGIIYQLYLQPNPQPPRHLFAPIITSSRNTLWDCDYNLHKSNSTYFADLDVGRAHAVGMLIRTGLSRLNAGDEVGLTETVRKTPGAYFVALGGVACFFQRQIEPLQAFEVWTRVLSWDRKWVYMVSHIVRKGAIVPRRYVMQPWKKAKRASRKSTSEDENKNKNKHMNKRGKTMKGKQEGKEQEEEEEDLTKHIFATSVSRYVFKKGRLTLNPEIILERSRLLPPRPEGVGLPPRAEAKNFDTTPTSDISTTGAPLVGQEDAGLKGPEAIAGAVSEKLTVAGGREFADEEDDIEEEEWTWEAMEQERLRGLKTAIHFDKLNACHNELRGGDVLGEYGDYW